MRVRHGPKSQHPVQGTPIKSLSVELLEIIFDHLSMLDLLRIRRVCNHWQAVVKSSPQLQRATFHGYVPIGPISPKELSKFVCDNSSNIGASCESQSIALSAPSSSVASLINSEKEGPELSVEIEKLVPTVHFNPVFPAQGNVLRTRTKQFRESLTSSSSWLDMYLTQPPCNYAVATVYHKQSSPGTFRRWARRDADTGICVVAISRYEGVRARDVLKAARQSRVDIKKWQRIDIHIPGVNHE